MTSTGPRILYFSMRGPSATRPVSATAAPRPASMMANSRGAVPGPKAKPRWPGSSAEATSANVANMTSTSPP